MKERDSVILAVRIPKDLLLQLDNKVRISKRRSRNDWLLWAIKDGLRDRHAKQGETKSGNTKNIDQG